MTAGAVPLRFYLAADDEGDPCMEPLETGEFVRFADVEEALKDRTMLDWLMPLLGSVPPNPSTYIARRDTLIQGRARGLTGRELVRWAMEQAP